ncbi:hypothetical protein [Butyrivibrio sp. VCB2001]|uniref:hypothetical protein n=1 Tax=Butyrivibrio sp. VCB2001 TaxID=1280667 RepID=UPI0004061D96|nr:hypothetical protein [Butyrivibrio sp. VCB2001]
MKTKLFRKIVASTLLATLLAGCSLSSDSLTQEAQEAAESLASQVIDESKDKIEEATKEAAKEAAKQVTENTKDLAQDLAQQAKESAKEAAKKAIEEAGNYDASQEDISSALSSMQTGLLTSAADIALTPQDDQGKNYTFTYDNKEYTAIHTTDHWKIKDSYDINIEADMYIICQALIDQHQIHGKDMVSYRTADDMVYEWEVHNLAYVMISDDDPMKPHARDVDFDPQDQGCNYEEIYYNHTGKEFDLSQFLGG